ncbi:MAG: hypothetical protein B6241_06900 [Spirochaetaceae bacterium 4572_59]|nr:MAG: hypothetical protein B6241_06900 [Spirochaetaceae bacterium 4572_59]
MSSPKEKLASCGLAVPEILMPETNIDLSKWAVIACDQFSSDKGYWQKVQQYVDDSPSTLNMILPECYLDQSEKRVPEINKTMRTYLNKGVLTAAGSGFVYMNRATSWVKSRKGLMVALDLEDYSYEKGAECQIRPTEGTVLERLPVRAAIRENAVLDIPHILVLFDDSENKIFSLLDSKKAEMKNIYDFDIPGEGGHLTGYFVQDSSLIDKLADIFVQLKEKSDFLFAVGDGNHSLGAAKQLWEKIKSQAGEDIMNHPARWALVELENIHDPGLNFEPIHRVLFDLDRDSFLSDLKSFTGFQLEKALSFSDMKEKVNKLTKQSSTGLHTIGIVLKGSHYLLKMKNASVSLAAEAFHNFLDSWLIKNSNTEVDYIHGEEVLTELSSQDKNIGFYLPGIDKSSFFSLITKKGALPRKTFSIGEAEEKRYYLECRKIIR